MVESFDIKILPHQQVNNTSKIQQQTNKPPPPHQPPPTPPPTTTTTTTSSSSTGIKLSSQHQLKLDEATSNPEKLPTVTSSSFNVKTNYERADIKPTKKRFLILLLFCLHSMINAAQWIYLSSITNIVTRYYHVDNMAVNWTSMVYMVVYIPLVVPATWLFEQIGMRNSILLGSLGTTVGSLIKCFSCQPDRFYLLMIGQTVVAVCQLFVLSVPPRLASVWFPDNQVSLANACGVFGNQFGIALGFVVPQLVIEFYTKTATTTSQDNLSSFLSILTIERALFNLFCAIAILSAITSMLILFLFDKSPSKPPGLARLQQIKQENQAVTGIVPLVFDTGANHSIQLDTTVVENGAASSGNTLNGACSQTINSQHQMTQATNNKRGGSDFLALLKDLLTDRNFLLLIISYGLNVGVFYAISTVLNQMIAPLWPEAGTLVGKLGLVMVISGMFGSVISGYILDKTHMYRAVNTTLYFLSLVSLLLFTLTLELQTQIILYLTVTMLGYFMTGYLVIGFEMSNEITWPRPESVSAGLLNLSAQVFGVVLTYLGSSLVDGKGNLVANLFFSLSVLLGLSVSVMIKAQMKRQNAVVS